MSTSIALAPTGVDVRKPCQSHCVGLIEHGAKAMPSVSMMRG